MNTNAHTPSILFIYVCMYLYTYMFVFTNQGMYSHEPDLPMNDHAGEEERVEVRQRAPKAASQPPAQSHHDVSRVLHLAGVAVPPVHQQVSCNHKSSLLMQPYIHT